MVVAGCCMKNPVMVSLGIKRNKKKMSGSLSSTANGIQRQDSRIHHRSSVANRSAKTGCLNSLDLQADVLEKGVTQTDPNGSKNVCIYLGIHPYGKTNMFGKQLWEMKDAVKKAVSNIEGNNAEDFKRICLAVAMSEATLMDAHDPLKKGSAANHSIYNLSSDMLQSGGFTGNLDSLDDYSFEHLQDATKCLLAYVKGKVPNTPTNQPAAVSAINFVRGGRTAYNNGGGDWFILMYRRAIQTIVSEMEKDNTLMGDNRRVDIIVPYI